MICRLINLLAQLECNQRLKEIFAFQADKSFTKIEACQLVRDSHWYMETLNFFW